MGKTRLKMNFSHIFFIFSNICFLLRHFQLSGSRNKQSRQKKIRRQKKKNRIFLFTIENSSLHHWRTLVLALPPSISWTIHSAFSSCQQSRFGTGRMPRFSCFKENHAVPEVHRGKQQSFESFVSVF